MPFLSPGRGMVLPIMAYTRGFRPKEVPFSLTSFPGAFPRFEVGKRPWERDCFFTLQVYEREGISRVQVYEREGKSVRIHYELFKGLFIEIIQTHIPYDWKVYERGILYQKP